MKTNEISSWPAGGVASGPAALRAAERDRGLLGDTRCPGPPRQAGLEPAARVPAHVGHGAAALRLLVPELAHDQLRLGARRQGRADQGRLGPRGREDAAQPRRQLHVRPEQRQGGIRHGARAGR